MNSGPKEGFRSTLLKGTGAGCKLFVTESKHLET